jgi:hypothetical protein
MTTAGRFCPAPVSQAADALALGTAGSQLRRERLSPVRERLSQGYENNRAEKGISIPAGRPARGLPRWVSVESLSPPAGLSIRADEWRHSSSSLFSPQLSHRTVLSSPASRRHQTTMDGLETPTRVTSPVDVSPEAVAVTERIGINSSTDGALPSGTEGGAKQPDETTVCGVSGGDDARVPPAYETHETPPWTPAAGNRLMNAVSHVSHGNSARAQTPVADNRVMNEGGELQLEYIGREQRAKRPSADEALRNGAQYSNAILQPVLHRGAPSIAGGKASARVEGER